MFKKLFIAILLAGFSFTTFSQNVEGVNARIDAMAGSGLTSDLGWAMETPCQIANFPDQFQGSIYCTPIPGIGGAYGLVIGVKSIGEHFRLGVAINERNKMSGAFYEFGCNYLMTNSTYFHLDGTDNAERWPMYPHIMACIKFNDDNNLGLGFFAEGQTFGLNVKTKVKYLTNAATNDSATYKIVNDAPDRKLTVYGGAIGGWIKAGPIHLRPTLKFGLPKLSGEETIDAATSLTQSLKQFPLAGGGNMVVENSKITWSSPNGLMLSGGLLGWTMLGDLELDVGLWYTDRRFQFEKSEVVDTHTISADGSVDNVSYGTMVSTKSVDIKSNSFDWFFGCRPSFSDNLYFAPEYDGGVGWDTSKDPNSEADTSFNTTYHNFRLGIEKSIPDFWICDNLWLRTGVVAYWFRRIRTITTKNGVTFKKRMPWTSKLWGAEHGQRQAKVAAGIGLEKGRGKIDVSVDFLNWKGTGVIAGPSAAIATISVDFGKNKEF